MKREKIGLSEKDFEDITINIENKVSKRLKDAELREWEMMRLIEALSSNVDSLAGSNLDPCSSNQGVISRDGSFERNAQEIEDSQDLTSCQS